VRGLFTASQITKGAGEVTQRSLLSPSEKEEGQTHARHVDAEMTRGDIPTASSAGESIEGVELTERGVPKYGRTVLAHVQLSLGDAMTDLAEVTAAVNNGRRLKPAERQHLSRMLAGVIGGCHTVRIWLEAGAPR
jgi:hypothetical protein